MNATEQLASFTVEVQANVRRIGEDFTEPDDDWISVAFLKSETEMHIIGLPGEIFANDHSKDVLADWLRMAMKMFQAKQYAVLFNVNGLENPSEEDWKAYRRGRRLADFPNSYELLLLISGDVEQELCHNARINRTDGAPPTLGEWELVPGFEGRFAGLNKRMGGLP